MIQGTTKKRKTPINSINKDAAKKAFLESIASGANISDAAKAANVERTTYYLWLKKDRKFRIALQHNEKFAIQAMEDALWQTGIAGDVQAQKFFLCNRRPEDWKNLRNVNLSGDLNINKAKDFLEDIKGMKEITLNNAAA
jgi:hypothetical protein